MERKKNILVTGGAGFIGSNIVKALIDDPRVDSITILDDFSTGNRENIQDFLKLPSVKLVEGDIRDLETCISSSKDVDVICHQAALGSVPRSINDPITTNDVNNNGTLNIFWAAVKNGIKRVVFAASSSTYGDHEGLPKQEDIIGKPLSPYAVTKFANELYANVFSKVYDFEYIGLRYFNIFGPNQDPRGAYAAVIPLFMKAAMDNKSPVINGDGTFSRDFTFVQNAVQANLKAIFSKNDEALNQIYNIACGESSTLNELWSEIKRVSQSSVDPIHGPTRSGDIPHSLADISKAKKLLNYTPDVKIGQGITITYKWFSKRFRKVNI